MFLFCRATKEPRPKHLWEDTKDTKISGESAGDRPAKGSGDGPKGEREQLAREDEEEDQEPPLRRFAPIADDQSAAPSSPTRERLPDIFTATT
jgi:hypothetical protein